MLEGRVLRTLLGHARFTFHHIKIGRRPRDLHVSWHGDKRPTICLITCQHPAKFLFLMRLTQQAASTEKANARKINNRRHSVASQYLVHDWIQLQIPAIGAASTSLLVFGKLLLALRLDLRSFSYKISP